MSLFPKNIHRIGFLDPRSHFPSKIFVGFDSSIRDLVDFRSRKMEITFSKIWKKFGNKIFPPGKFIEANFPQSCFESFAP